MNVSPVSTVVDRSPLANALSILVVDDNPLVREATAWMLAGAGHDVTEADDGITALQQIEQQGPFDLVISDITMPRMNGLALNDAVRQRWPGLPVLLISGRRQRPGTGWVMMKPFNAQDLLHAVAEIAHTSG